VSLIVLQVTKSSHRDQDGECTRCGFIEIKERTMLDRARQPHDNGAWACQVIDHTLHCESDVLLGFSLFTQANLQQSRQLVIVFFTTFIMRLPKGRKT
jgi:hypothetical protein